VGRGGRGEYTVNNQNIPVIIGVPHIIPHNTAAFIIFALSSFISYYILLIKLFGEIS
tara:strand:- start:6376 stop:6546 length:171 start_codon:yes stop_codon:yes gene_type:complete